MKGTNLQLPYLGPRLPRYPLTTQMVRITGSALFGRNVYAGVMEQSVGNAPVLRDREQVWVWEPNGVVLTGGIYKALLMGTFENAPVYVTSQACCILPPPPFPVLPCCPDTCYQFTATGFDCPLNGTYTMTGTTACNWSGTTVSSSSSSRPSSSSGSAAVTPPITNLCCPPTLPATLHATLSGGVGGCSCLNGVIVPVTWNGSVWVGSVTNVCTGNTVTLAFQCFGSGVANLKMITGSNCGVTAFTGLPVTPTGSCVPLNAVYSSGLPSGCCSGAVTITLTQ